MTKKHYEAIAAAIRSEYNFSDDGCTKRALKRLTAELAAQFAADNRHFDSVRFYDAAIGKEDTPP